MIHFNFHWNRAQGPSQSSSTAKGTGNPAFEFSHFYCNQVLYLVSHCFLAPFLWWKCRSAHKEEMEASRGMRAAKSSKSAPLWEPCLMALMGTGLEKTKGARRAEQGWQPSHWWRTVVAISFPLVVFPDGSPRTILFAPYRGILCPSGVSYQSDLKRSHRRN